MGPVGGKLKTRELTGKLMKLKLQGSRLKGSQHARLTLVLFTEPVKGKRKSWGGLQLRCPQHGRTHRSGEGRAPSLAETAIQAEPNQRPPHHIGFKKAPCVGIKQNPSPNLTLRWRISQRFLKLGFPQSPTNSSPFYPLPLTLATHKQN